MGTVTFFMGLGLFFFILTCWAILDASQKDFGTLGKKALWMLVAAIPFIGVIIYFIFGYRKGKKPSETGASQNNV